MIDAGRSLCLLAFFHLVLSSNPLSDPGDVAGNVMIKGVTGVYSEEDAITRLHYTTVTGKEQITLRPEILHSSPVSNCSKNGLCGSGGECAYLDENLPTHRVVCYCHSGFRGRYCSEAFRTKLMISFFFWGVFVFEVILIGIALCRSGDESSYPCSPTARALVFILQDRRLD